MTTYTNHALLCFLLLGVVVAADVTIPEACRKVANADPNVSYSFCVVSLQGTVPAGQAVALERVGLLAVREAVASAAETRSRIRKLMRRGRGGGNYMRRCLDDCFDLYDDAAAALKDSAKAVVAGRWNDASTWLSGVLDAPATCDQGFRDRKGVADPLEEANRELSQLTAIALTVVSLVA